MIRTALKTVFAHKLRLALTAMSVMMGVAFIAGTFIFTDTIDETFNDLFDDLFAEPVRLYDVTRIMALAAKHGIVLHGGSIFERDGDAVLGLGGGRLRP